MRLNYRGLSVATLVVSCLSGALADSLTLNVNNYYNTYQSSYQSMSNVNESSSLTSSFSAEDVAGHAVGYGESTASASFGVLKGGASLLVTDASTALGGQSGYGFASWSADVNASGTGLVGMNFTIDIHGLVDSFGTPGLHPGYTENAQFSVEVAYQQVGTPTTDSDTISGSSVNGVYTGFTLPSIWTTKSFAIDASQTYTQTVTLRWLSQIAQDHAQPNAGPWSQSADVDMGHTIIWDGGQGFDAGGHQVADFHLVGQHGRDWSRPAAVPEPMSVFALAGGALFLVRRNKK